MLAKLADLKVRLEQANVDDFDDILSQMLQAASADAERAAGRPLERKVDRVEFVIDEPWQKQFANLALFPVQSITSVKQLWYPGDDAAFDAIDPLVEYTDYTVDAANGKLERINAKWKLKNRCLRVQYTAGYQDPSEVAIDGAAQVPEDLQQAVIEQAVWYWNTRDQAGITKIDLGGDHGGISTTTAKMHPHLEQVCRSLRRWR